MEFMGITGVAGIVVICYLVGLVVKATPWNNNKIIPIVCGMAGAALGVAGMYVMPEFPATDPITAVAVGIVSGLAATGADQAVKQLKQ
ncbi:phage holin family protein [Allofournierella massiliensis]|uniref:Holin family Hol44 protein (Superfamily V) n=1 Tax=Allofournierella massiliensis TaxID=1650663 RepID=A0A4V2QA35_9FIRM|nr:phage holin family protein [Fournierella massiliensis]TCL47737.1 holin family Hol44 protein (superfamily V) [Fournierella massiliensis]